MGVGKDNHVKMEKRGKRMKKIRFWTIVITLVISLIIVTQGKMTHAESLEEIKAQIADLSHQMQLSVDATTPLEAEVTNLNSQIASIQSQIQAKEESVRELEAGIAERESKIKIQYRILASKVRDYYKKSRMFSPILILVSSQSAGDLTRGLTYKSISTDEDKNLIVSITGDIIQLESDKERVESDRVVLAGLQDKLDAQRVFFEQEISGAKKWQAELSGKLATLTAKQQSILSEKSGTFQTTVGDVPLADDPASRPDYNPGFSPAYAAFSFGAPHFKGMSQYGAYGRAKSGQSAEDILRAYYGGVEIRKDYPNETIVLGRYDNGNLICDQGSVDLETYAQRIYEVPGSWGDSGGMEALKAQAVAAKSYALATVKNKGCICMTESCQVYKPSNKGGKWEEAVNAVSGWVMIASGEPLWAQYASTSGGYQETYSSSYNSGYSTPGFWDTANGRDGWTSQAYEKIAESPWFYKAWYKTRSGDSCGENHPWLNSEEMADILNAWVVLYQGGGASDRVTPESSCWDGNPYSKEELVGIGGYTSVSGVSVQYGNNGVTANVTFQTNKGSTTIAGSEFYKAFNLRAPGRIALKSGLFNIEQK